MICLANGSGVGFGGCCVGEKMALPTVILPGYFAGAAPYLGVEAVLRSLDIPVMTVPLRRRDWIPTLGGRSVLPILQRVDETVMRLKQETGCDRVNLVGHSAGGWIARIYLGEVPYDIHAGDAEKSCVWRGHEGVETLVTLGTPHVSQERWTRKNLDFVKDNYPGAFYSDVRYVCVAGKAVFGKRTNWFTYSSYELTSGRGDCWGDEITPVDAALLEGAENVVLEGVVHSPRPGKVWYGSPEIVKGWAQYL
jgi:triacylglycerol esterase/lipase EstA (alpha/beta hydrolase family)